jgi:hypothetical protein
LVGALYILTPRQRPSKRAPVNSFLEKTYAATIIILMQYGASLFDVKSGSKFVKDKTLLPSRCCT